MVYENTYMLVHVHVLRDIKVETEEYFLYIVGEGGDDVIFFLL